MTKTVAVLGSTGSIGRQTLQVAQDLYEKKLTTYPRTDARVLS